LPGLRFFFDGQFEGADVRGPVQLGRWPANPDNPDICDLYARLLAAIDKPLFHHGEWRLLDCTATDLIACSWRQGNELAIVAVNITDRGADGLVNVGDLPDGGSFQLVDQLADRSCTWKRQDLLNGLYVKLASGDAHLFIVR
jgi:hypothetical protein